MKTKVFTCGGGRSKELETEMNKWLRTMHKSPDAFRLISLTQSTTDYYFDGSKRETMVIILYSGGEA